MKRFILLTNSQMDPDLSITKKVQEYILSRGGSCWLPPAAEREYYDLTDIPADSECAITLGGDGTFLNAARNLHFRGIPIFGINIGNLGYLTSAEIDDLPQCIDELFRDEYRMEERMMLNGRIKHVSGDTVTDSALNDVVISRAGHLRVVEFRIFVDDEPLNVYDADGIIVATATGSTGYNLSAGGPVVMTGTDVMVITPICPHTLQSRSVVVNADSVVRIEIGKRRKTVCEEAIVTFDGTLSEHMTIIDSVEIVKSKEKTRIIKRSGSGLFSIFNNAGKL